MNKLQEFCFKPQFGKILKHVPNFKHMFKNIFPLIYLPLVEFLGHIKCTQASVSGWAALAPGGLLLAMQMAILVEQDSVRSQSKKTVKAAQSCGEQQTLAKYPSTCEACALHRLRAFHTQDTKWV